MSEVAKHESRTSQELSNVNKSSMEADSALDSTSEQMSPARSGGDLNLLKNTPISPIESSPSSLYSTSTPILSKNDPQQLSSSSFALDKAVGSSSNNNSLVADDKHAAMNTSGTTVNSIPLNEKVASLASSVYTELEKIVKLHGRDTVKDLMSILVTILEALDMAYQEKEEQIVENELLRDDYEKLLSQYEREKLSRKETELKLFQSEDSFAEQKRDYEEKVKSLESIVRMIDLKSKNTSDQVMRLEEKENELKREYTKLHERYTELFKTHCDYMDRTKILFGNDNRLDPNYISSNGSRIRVSHPKNGSVGNNGSTETPSQLIDLLRSPTATINRNDLINSLKSSSRGEINLAINTLLSHEMHQTADAATSSGTAPAASSSSTIAASSSSSLSSLTSQKKQPQSQQTQELNNNDVNNILSEKSMSETSAACLIDEGNDVNADMRNKLNLNSSENFDEHLSPNCVEFDDTASDIHNNSNKNSHDLDKEYEEEDEISTKNDLSLFNELSRENYDITELDDGADLTGMTREVANLIRENSELLQTKHALNVLKDDLIVRLDQFSSEMVILREEIKSLQTVKAALQLRISELEEEAKKTREELAQKVKRQEEEDENVPMSQRKRFTRAEMARVLMERNQYKERLMDLQEAVRWTEMMRASKLDPSVSNSTPFPVGANGAAMIGDSTTAGAEQQEHKKKSTVWKFFSDLFGSSSSSPSSGPGSTNSTTGSSSQAKPTTGILLSPSSKRANKFEQVVPHGELSSSQMVLDKDLSDKAAKAYEFLKEDSQNVKLSSKQIEKKSSLVKDDGRMQAYGWSLPSKGSLTNSGGSGDLAKVAAVAAAQAPITVPVPVYCRPLFEQDNSLKLSCSSTINYSFDAKIVKNCGEIIEASLFSHFKSAETKNAQYKSSCVWICNLNGNDTHVSILDANRPGDLIEQFTLKYLKVHCVQSISGASQNEFPLSEDKLKKLSNNLKETNSSLILAKQSEEAATSSGERPTTEKSGNDSLENITYIECDNEQDPQSQFENTKPGDEVEAKNSNDHEKLLTSLYPTMWLGSQEGWLLIHSTVSNVSKTIDKVKLKDTILCITQNGGRVIVGLADGTLAIFHRNNEGLWDLKNFYLINFDKPHHSIRCLTNVNENVWCGCRNKIFVLNPDEFKILSTIEVHPRKENQVRHMAWVDDGVWVSIRLDSTLRLYHAKTMQHLQYLDIEPFITRMLGTSNLGLSLIRISSLMIGSKRLWIGTGNGVVLSLPFNDCLKDASNSAKPSIPGSALRSEPTEESSVKSIPYCNLSEAQFSFHGHRNAVKFFLSVPSEAIQKLSLKAVGAAPSSSPSDTKAKDSYEKVETTLVLSGGHGYIDFRIGDSASGVNERPAEQRYDDIKTEIMENKPQLNKNERSHLIVWQVNSTN